MIVTRISGGLGNQMFEYAMGRALALRNETDLHLDISSYRSGYHRTAPRLFELEHFNIQAHIAQSEDFKKLGIPDPHNQSLLAKTIRAFLREKSKYKPACTRTYIVEDSYDFSLEILKAGKNCFLSGVWQSEKYFKDIADRIRIEFSLKNAIGDSANEILKLILGVNSVSVHFRRGDYVTKETTNAKHGVCSLEYYEKAIAHIREKVDTPHLFIFSDDIDWARKNFLTDLPHTFVSNPEIKDYEELHLIRSCTHNIIANSSFSWWGAWLNPHSDKIVIAPKFWLASRISTPDIVPETWVRV